MGGQEKEKRVWEERRGEGVTERRGGRGSCDQDANKSISFKKERSYLKPKTTTTTTTTTKTSPSNSS